MKGMADPQSGVPDARLVEQARRGDGAAFEALVRRHFRGAYAIALAVVGNAMDAEDVCQDSFIRALERLEQCKQPERFAAWLFQIVRNRGHNFREYQRVRSGPPVDVVEPASSADPGRDADRSRLRALLEEALQSLTVVQRQVVLLHDMDGWKHKEIAETLSISEGMSRQHLMAARRQLRASLGSHVFREYVNE